LLFGFTFVVLESFELFFMLDLVADVVLALAISHTAAIGFQELVVWLILRV
jgi:hypothetical protein